MRMWKIPPDLLCRQHLLGEHRELHALAVSVARASEGDHKHKAMLTGHVHKQQVELTQLVDRHHQVVTEMFTRGYHHHSPLGSVVIDPEIALLNTYHPVDVASSFVDLRSRCEQCASRMTGT